MALKKETCKSTGTRKNPMKLFRNVRIVLALMVLTGVAFGCGNDGGEQALGVGEGAGGVGSEQAVANTPTTMVPIREALADEQKIFDQMFAETFEDQEISVGELEQFALEAVACTKRAGFEALLIEFDAKNRQTGFTVSPAAPDGEGPGDHALDRCVNTFYIPVSLWYTESNNK